MTDKPKVYYGASIEAVFDDLLFRLEHPEEARELWRKEFMRFMDELTEELVKPEEEPNGN